MNKNEENPKEQYEAPEVLDIQPVSVAAGEGVSGDDESNTGL